MTWQPAESFSEIEKASCFLIFSEGGAVSLEAR